MFVNVNTNQKLINGTLIQYDTESKKWVTATSSTYPLGCLNEDSYQNDDGLWVARATFAGTCYAITSETIPTEGGLIEVEGGAVKMSRSDTSIGLVAPSDAQTTARVAGDLVMIFLRS